MTSRLSLDVFSGSRKDFANTLATTNMIRIDENEAYEIKNPHSAFSHHHAGRIGAGGLQSKQFHRGPIPQFQYEP